MSIQFQTIECVYMLSYNWYYLILATILVFLYLVLLCLLLHAGGYELYFMIQSLIGHV